MIKIDSHLHVWPLLPSHSSDGECVAHDRTSLDLYTYLEHFRIQGVILTQSKPTLAETNLLFDYASQYSAILGVVGWVDLLSPDVSKHLMNLSLHPKFLGIRLMLDEINDIDWILKKQLAPGLEYLIRAKKTLDLLIKSKHLSNVLHFVARYPQLKVVIDHAGTPEIKDRHFEPWASLIKILAKHPNVYCKLTGLFTEKNYPKEQLKPYLDHVFIYFGPSRIMWGSNFPQTYPYKVWYELCERYVNHLGPDAFKKVFGEVAQQFYGLKRLS